MKKAEDSEVRGVGTGADGGVNDEGMSGSEGGEKGRGRGKLNKVVKTLES